MLEANPVTSIGLDDPLNVDGDVDGLGVTVKEETTPPVEVALKDTDILPSLYDLPEG